ncbi:MAG: RNA polymerase sigma factor SigZ [Candidatus Neomarinimicrobiota bacterium]
MGNESNFIFHQYHDRLYNFIMSRVNDPDIADDILQDVFLKIHTKMNTLKDLKKIHSWIYQITRNTIIDHYRSMDQTYELLDTYNKPSSEPDPPGRAEISSWLRPMIESLPDKYREVLLLSEIEGLSQNETAKKIGLSLPGTKSRIQRGRGLVKKMLLQCCHFEFDRRGRVLNYREKSDTCTHC